jgi:uncharacterized membrane protein
VLKALSIRAVPRICIVAGLVIFYMYVCTMVLICAVVGVVNNEDMDVQWI